jgi:hypothetical protein
VDEWISGDARAAVKEGKEKEGKEKEGKELEEQRSTTAAGSRQLRAASCLMVWESQLTAKSGHLSEQAAIESSQDSMKKGKAKNRRSNKYSTGLNLTLNTRWVVVGFLTWVVECQTVRITEMLMRAAYNYAEPNHR